MPSYVPTANNYPGNFALAKMKLSRSGRFSLYGGPQDESSGGVLSGRLNRNAGTGRISAIELWNANNEPDPNGTVRCLSDVTFKAKKR